MRLDRKDDVIKRSAKVQLMHINVIRFKASVMCKFLDGIKWLSLLNDLVSYDTTVVCLIFF